MNPVLAGEGIRSGPEMPRESKSAFRRAVDLSFDAQDDVRRFAIIADMAAAGTIYEKPKGRKRGR